MAPRTHHLTRVLLGASALLLALLGAAPAERAPAWGLVAPVVEGTLLLDEAPGEVGEAVTSSSLAAPRVVALLVVAVALPLSHALRRRRTSGRTPWRPVVWPAPANRAPPHASA